MTMPRVPLLAATLLALSACAGDAPTSDRSTSRSMLRVGDHMLDSGELSTAETFYRGAAERDPTDPEPRLRLANLRARQGDPDAAMRAYMEAVAADPGNAEARKAAAGLLLRRGDRASAGVALDLLAPIAGSSGRDARTPRLQGVALDLLGRQAEAAEAYRRGLAVNPNDPALRANLALSLAVAGQADAAMEEAGRAMAAPGSGPAQRGTLVLVLAIAGRDADAQREAALLPPGEADAVLAKGRSAARQTDPAGRAAALGISRG
ncbi:tetratricopeptide repeat protein [Pararoseomonas sp. SCSIO 73927]|uniref:tetratricopeptide repeat protein n=1 Tax=Pararoseomonas sp. SCSIO 73927 TaxID=3114537 RepID=UPI0030CEB158